MSASVVALAVALQIDMRWSPCTAASEADGGEPPPSPRSGHSATLVGGDRVVVFGGLHGKHFCGDTVVFDVTLARWFRLARRPSAAPVRAPSTAPWR